MGCSPHPHKFHLRRTLSHGIPTIVRMNILITGGAGFIGSNLVEFHLNRGDRVLAVDDLSTGREVNIEAFLGNPHFHFVKADLLTWANLAAEVARADRLYHLAAVVGMFRVLQEPAQVTRVNVGATELVLKAVVQSGHQPQIVIASSSSVYGHCHTGELREDIELIFVPKRGGLTSYALSKLTNEIQAMAYQQAYGLNIVIPRLFNAVGPRQTGTYGFVLPRFIQQALSGSPLTVFGDGTQTRSFCDVRDTCIALDLLASTPAAYGQAVNVGNTREIRILDLAQLVLERSHSISSLEFIPLDQAYGESFEHITQRRPITDKLHSLTNFIPQWALESTIDSLIIPSAPATIPKGVF